ncbi:hypothetical protein N0V90_007840 [Kalmusia sp. IMI 367209]|nr:hypothetical protein N0V90_007840 [Kalmusia sp. IMI 367209]
MSFTDPPAGVLNITQELTDITLELYEGDTTPVAWSNDPYDRIKEYSINLMCIRMPEKQGNSSEPTYLEPVELAQIRNISNTDKPETGFTWTVALPDETPSNVYFLQLNDMSASRNPLGQTVLIKINRRSFSSPQPSPSPSQTASPRPIETPLPQPTEAASKGLQIKIGVSVAGIIGVLVLGGLLAWRYPAVLKWCCGRRKSS